MFWHNLKYSLKVLFQNKILIFWTFAFPIVLSIFFNMAFSNIENNEKLKIIDIAVVNGDNSIYKTAFDNLSDEENDYQMFNTKYVAADEAKELLKDEEITGYITINGDDLKITVNKTGINETVLRFVVDEIKSNTIMIGDLASKEIINMTDNINYEDIYQKVSNKVLASEGKINNISNQNLSYTMIEYYTLIAMSCLYSGMLAMVAVNYKLANMNSVGKRTGVSPAKKGSMIISSLIASYIVQLIGLLLLFVFTIFVLKVNYGDNLGLIILLALIGTLAGLSLGVCVATLFKTNENSKTGIMIAITMIGCFFSGMMGITMKYIIDKNIPIINIINPCSMITDGFYSLYYYDTLQRFWFNILSLVIFSVIMITLSYRGLRRQKYDSI